MVRHDPGRRRNSRPARRQFARIPTGMLSAPAGILSVPTEMVSVPTAVPAETVSSSTWRASSSDTNCLPNAPARRSERAREPISRNPPRRVTRKRAGAKSGSSAATPSIGGSDRTGRRRDRRRPAGTPVEGGRRDVLDRIQVDSSTSTNCFPPQVQDCRPNSWTVPSTSRIPVYTLLHCVHPAITRDRSLLTIQAPLAITMKSRINLSYLATHRSRAPPACGERICEVF